jgi:N-acetylmuramoyl-L-alanine amidase
MRVRQASRRRTAGQANSATPDRGSRGPTAEEFVQKCLEERGDEYEWGGEYTPGTPANQTREWDCSGLVYTKLKELGLDPPRSSTQQLKWCRQNDTIIPLEEAIRTRGALLLREGHVAVSLGDGKTIESMGEKQGVGIFSATDHRTFTVGGLVPGLTYGRNRVPPAQAQPRTPVQPTPYPILRRGSSGSDVQFLQQKLKELGYDPGPVDGDFGPRTERTVKDFQAASGLVVDGVVGPQTWGALTRDDSTTPPTGTSSRVELAQRVLNHANVTLWDRSPISSAGSDGADAQSNIRDTANSKAAKRSNYENAPGAGYISIPGYSTVC